MFTPSPAHHRSSPPPFSSLPPHAPAIIVSNTTTLQNPTDIPSYAHSTRHRDFNLLVQKYTHQLLYGCKRNSCTTPTCATARRALKKDNGSSRREFTVLSARIIASQLATAEEPYRGLCPGLQLNSNLEDNDLNLLEGVEKRRDNGMRDSKSFMQGLFSTAAVRGLEGLVTGVLPPTTMIQEDPEVKEDKKEVTNSTGVRNGLTKDRTSQPQITTPRSNPTNPTNPNNTNPPRTPTSKPSRRKLSHDLSSYLTSPKNSFFTPDVGEMQPPPLHRHVSNRTKREPDATPTRIKNPMEEKSSTPGTTVRTAVPQAVTHFSTEIINAMIGMMEDGSVTKLVRKEAEGFLRQSCHYVFGSVETVAACFPGDIHGEKSVEVVGSVKRLFERGMGREVVNSLWKALGELFPTIQEVEVGNGKRKVVNPAKIPKETAAKVFIMTVHVLTAACPRKSPDVWEIVRRTRSKGGVSLDVSLEDEGLRRLVGRFVRAFEAFSVFEDGVRTLLKAYLLNYAELEKGRRVERLRKELGKDLAKEVVGSGVGKGGWGLSVCVMEWVRAGLLGEWDGGERPRSGGVVAGCLNFLKFLYEDHEALGLEESYFHNQVLADRLEYKDMPVKWYLKQPKCPSSSSDTEKPGLNQPHLLNYAFLLPPSALVKFFRSINFHRMSAAYDDALAMYRFVNQMSDVARRDNYKPWLRNFIMGSYNVAMNMYLLLEIRRDSVIMDTLNALVGRELRECLRPLKVRFMDVGEEGVDHGGVQQEYFRLVWEEVTKGEYGAFTTDPGTRMSWFSVVTLEPMHKFELLGLLVGLAVYNGVTLPVSFPEVLYRKLLGWEVKLENLSDGWPELTKGLRSLLDWNEEDGDVADIFVRGYEFGYEVFGEVYNVDIGRIGREDRWEPVKVVKEKVRGLEALDWLPAGSKIARSYRTLLRHQNMAAQGRRRLEVEVGAGGLFADQRMPSQEGSDLGFERRERTPEGERAMSPTQEILEGMRRRRGLVVDEGIRSWPPVSRTWGDDTGWRGDDVLAEAEGAMGEASNEDETRESRDASDTDDGARRRSGAVIDENDEAAATWRAYIKSQQERKQVEKEEVAMEEEEIENESTCSSTSPVKITSGRFVEEEEREEAEMVTNENRKKYVEDYIFWLTDKSMRPQYEAFEKGFHAVLDRRSLSLFNPHTLRHLVEGSKEIDILALEAAAKYDDGYHPGHRCIKDFWAIVREYDNAQKRALLEFVTASDRVPVSGIGSVMFVIQRNGGDSERVPTSLTCFGRLLLPEYAGREKMREKLGVALENGRGFGVP